MVPLDSQRAQFLAAFEDILSSKPTKFGQILKASQILMLELSLPLLLRKLPFVQSAMQRHHRAQSGTL